MADDVVDDDPRVRRALTVGLVAILVLVGLCGWLGYRAQRSDQADRDRVLYVNAAKQAAVSLTTVDYKRADVDVRRILDSSTGKFHDEFTNRAGPFVDVVKQTLSTSSGVVTEAGVESMTGNEGQVLVAVTVMTSNRGQPQPQPRYWRMRLTVTKDGQGAKVSKVDFP